jgi:hypothetical protein
MRRGVRVSKRAAAPAAYPTAQRAKIISPSTAAVLRSTIR